MILELTSVRGSKGLVRVSEIIGIFNVTEDGKPDIVKVVCKYDITFMVTDSYSELTKAWKEALNNEN